MKFSLEIRFLFGSKKYPLISLLNKRNVCGLNLWNEDLGVDTRHKIESYWKSRLKHENFDENDSSREKYYLLSMFPYPSGHLHMGHVRVYTISDTMARFQRMNGKNVIHPIGWDAFGLPAENAAIDRQIAPYEWTSQNIAYMKSQLQQLGCSFEWHRELATCDPTYYQFTQELFLKLYDAGLVYQRKAVVNWDPVDKTVLADEQVDENGCSWRSGAKVEKKLLKQWFIKTTKFAKALLEGLSDPILQEWRDIIKIQSHWIGECDGVSFDFTVVDETCLPCDTTTLWTSQPEFINEVKFVTVSDKHSMSRLNGSVLSGGTKLLNIYIENPFNKEKLPVYVTDEIEYLPSTDSFLGIPGSCEKAAVFADKYNIKFKQISIDEEHVSGLRNTICEQAKRMNIGGYWTSAKLKDWLISRQRYWGTPIPIIHCDKCGTQPVSRQNLPVTLPKLSKYAGKGSSLLAECSEYINVECPKCKGAAKRETDTMDTFVDSSWYYLRYIDSDNSKEMFGIEKAKKMTPVDLYIGGKEHAVLHLYYARFVSHFLHSLGMLPEKEPFKRLLVQGMVMGRSYRIKGTGQYVPESDVKIVDLKKNKAVMKSTGVPVVVSWEKMSKSKLNGVDPESMFKEYGTDTTRLLILADVAPTSHRNWNSNTFPGIINWQKRLWLTVQDFIKHRREPPKMIAEDKFRAHDDYMFDSRNYYIKGATFNYCVSQQLSVAVSKQQGLTNSIRRSPPAVFAHSLQFERALACQIILLAPMAPHFASELWSGFVSVQNRLNVSDEIMWDRDVLEQRWPEVDPNYQLDLVCKVNGTEQCIVKLQRKYLDAISKDDAIHLAIREKSIQSVLNGRNVIDTSFDLYPGCEAVINLKTQPHQKMAESTHND